MMKEQLLEQALKLSDAERADLAAILIDSLDRTVEPNSDVAWESEIARGVAELDRGDVAAVPGAEARKQWLR
ncbi:MAG: addiction module protein [Phycisphaerales bacterium]|nr:addiction module protein [Phycisphaerales bacterium]